jgi:hypothetical protein
VITVNPWAAMEIRIQREQANNLRLLGFADAADAADQLAGHQEALVVDRARTEAQNVRKAMAALSRTVGATPADLKRLERKARSKGAAA